MSVDENESIRIKYKGKVYNHLEDFAHDNGVKTSIVKDRYSKGHRDPEKLLHEGRIPFKFKGAHKLVYKDVEYPSLIEFCRCFKLNYRKALALWKRNIRDPQQIMNKAKYSDNKVVLQQTRKADLSNIEKIVNKHGYLTSNQVADRTNLDPDKIRDQVTRLLAGQRNNMGVAKDDIVKITYSSEEVASISKNNEVLPGYVFKPIVVEHIKKRLNKINNPCVKHIPFRNTNYYFDEDTNKVYSKQRSDSILKELSLSQDHYVLRDNSGHRFSFTVDTIRDLIDHPEITADKLLTREDIINKFNMPQNAWNNRRVYSVLPLKIGHLRYDTQGKLIRGWTEETVEGVAFQHPKYFAAKTIKNRND